MKVTAPRRSQHAPSHIGLLRILLSLLLLLQALGGLVPGPLLWGVNHLAYASPVLRILWPLFGIFLIWTSAGDRIGRWLINRVAPVLLGQRLVAYVVAPVVGALLFWSLRCKTHFLGDGWLLGEMVAAGLPFHGFDFIHYHLIAKLFRTLALPVEADAFILFAGTSIVAGAFYLVVAAWSARNLSKDDGQRILLYLLLVFFAPVEMFMGYVECYSILMVFMLLFLAAVALHYRRGLPAWVPAAAFGLGLAFHLNALFLAPLLPVLVFWPARRASRSVLKRLASVALPVAAAMVLAASFYLLEGYNRSKFEFDFVKSRQTQKLLVTLLGSHGFLSWRHWKDVLNLLLLVAPVPLVMLLVAALRRKPAVVASRSTASAAPRRLDERESKRPATAKLTRPDEPKQSGEGKRSDHVEQSDDSERRALITLLFGSLLLVFLMSSVHMKLGIARDWDLFAAQTPIFVLAAYLAWSKLARGRSGSRLVGIAVSAAMFLSLPWFWLNASEVRSVQRFKDIVADQPGFSRAYAHEELGKYYRKQGMILEALEEYRICAQLFPDNARFCAVLGGLQYNRGLRDDALRSFSRALQADSTYALALKMVARIHAERSEFEQALVYARKLAGSQKESSDAAALHGVVAEKLGLYDEALRAYAAAVEKDPRRLDLVRRIKALREKSCATLGRPETS
jgi:Tfp pilus assembly protein PilF